MPLHARLVAVLFSVVAPLCGQSTASPLSLMPAPASVSVAHGRLSLDSSFNVSTVKFTDGRLERAIDRMLHRLADRSGLTLSRKKNQNQTAHANLLIYTETPGMQVQGI